MSEHLGNLVSALARAAEAVCCRYLSNGVRKGRYWIVGDINNTPGRSLYVRLRGDDTGKGAAGKWAEYVAPTYMLRIFDWVPSRGRLTASMQHNASVPREVA